MVTELETEYTRLLPDLRALKQRVDPIFEGLADRQKGYMLSRIKEPDSIFEKILLGDAAGLDEMDDLVAATIVLPTLAPTCVEDVERALRGKFELLDIRTDRTRRPTEFVYDDLHYVLRLLPLGGQVSSTLTRWKIELQVKSNLQHAWSSAIHDAIYKGRAETWRAARVAAQTKALVELAEASIAKAHDLLPESAERPYETFDHRAALLDTVETWWQGDLPDNRRRLSIFLDTFLRMARIDRVAFAQLLRSARADELAQKLSLTAQQAILVLLIETARNDLYDGCRRQNRKLFISGAMEDASPPCRDVPEELRLTFA